MSNNSDQSASFVLRFTQQLFQDEKGNTEVQWRGNITHVQSDDRKRFTEVEEALEFIQNRLTDLTKTSTQHHTAEEQKGLLQKSLRIWNKVSKQYPKFVLDTIKDPKTQVENIQEQIKEGIHQVSEEISEKLELNEWQLASKNDYKRMVEMMETLSSQVITLSKKVEELSQKKA